MPERELERVKAAWVRRAGGPRLTEKLGPSEPLRMGEDGREIELAETGVLLRLTVSNACG